MKFIDRSVQIITKRTYQFDVTNCGYGDLTRVHYSRFYNSSGRIIGDEIRNDIGDVISNIILHNDILDSMDKVDTKFEKIVPEKPIIQVRLDWTEDGGVAGSRIFPEEFDNDEAAIQFIDAAKAAMIQPLTGHENIFTIIRIY